MRIFVSDAFQSVGEFSNSTEENHLPFIRNCFAFLMTEKQFFLPFIEFAETDESAHIYPPKPVERMNTRTLKGNSSSF